MLPFLNEEKLYSVPNFHVPKEILLLLLVTITFTGYGETKLVYTACTLLSRSHLGGCQYLHHD